MKSLGDFLHDQFKKAGQNVDEQAIKDFLLGLPPTTMIPDEVAKALDNNLLSVADAKNNHQEIKNHYTKSALDAVDKVIEESIKDLPDADKADVLAERSSYKRITLANAKIKETEAKKAGAGKGDKDVLQKQVDELHTQLAAKEKEKQALKTDFDGNLLKYRVTAEQKNRLAKYKTIYDDLPPEVRDSAIVTLLKQELQDKGADLTFDDKDSFTLLKKDGSNFYGDNHQLVTPDQFIEQLLSRHKLLITTPKPGEKPPVTQTQPAGSGGDKNTGSATLKTLVKEAQTAIEKQVAVA